MREMKFDTNTTSNYSDLHFTLLGSTSSSKGCFLKAFENGIYYKLSNYDSYFKTFGNESIYEVIAHRVGELLGIKTVPYWICKGKVNIDGSLTDAVFCASKDFNPNRYRKVTLETLFEMQKEPNEDVLAFCKRIGIIEYINEMMIFDYIICNRDRHGANIELLLTENGIIPVPIFDNGVSFLFSCSTEEQIAKYDIKNTPRANNYVGSQDLEYNLSLIQRSNDMEIGTIDYSHYDYIFDGIQNLLSDTHKNKIMEMIVWRCHHAKEILYSR